MNLISFLSQQTHPFLLHLYQHIYLSFSAIFLAIAIGIPLGTLSHQHKALQRIILPTNNILQTIPSLALLAFLVPFLGIGFKPTIVTLTLYALLPVTKNTYAGLENVTNDMIEAAHGLGFTRWQRLRLVELPLATPIIIAGVRLATTMAIGITTIAAFIGAGGLGAFITEGLALNDSRLILLGAIPTALLALVVDTFLAQTEALLKKPKNKLPFPKIRWALVILFITLLCWLFLNEYKTSTGDKKHSIIIGTKNFSESYILGYLMKDLIQTRTNLSVNLKLNIGGTTILQNALLKGEIDIYPEYTGTAYLIVLKQKKILTPTKTLKYVQQQYKKRFHLIWLPSFGFNNSEALAVRSTFAKRHRLKTLSDLSRIAPQLIIAAPPEFLKRPDTLPALQRAYGLHFKKVLAMQPDLVYRAIKAKDVDVIEASTTDARISAYHLVVLKDNKHIYPPYDAAPIIREATLKQYPQIKKALAPLAGLIDNKTMRQLNAKVTIQHKNPRTVALQFLRKAGFKV